MQIARDALLDLLQTPLHLGVGEVLVTIVDHLELAAIDRNTRIGEQPHRAAERDETGAHLANGQAVVFAEVGNRLVVGNQPAGQPHHLNIAPGLALEPPARLDPVQIAVNVKLQEDRWMVRRPSRRLRIDPAKPQLRKIKLLDEDINHPYRIVLVDKVLQAFRKQCRLTAIYPINEALHSIPRESSENHIYSLRRFHTARVILDRVSWSCLPSTSASPRKRTLGMAMRPAKKPLAGCVCQVRGRPFEQRECLFHPLLESLGQTALPGSAPELAKENRLAGSNLSYREGRDEGQSTGNVGPSLGAGSDRQRSV